MLEFIEEDSVELACKAFQLIVHSERPLTIEELVEALAVNDSNTRLDFSSTFSDPRDLLRICSSLIYDGETKESPWWMAYAPAQREDESYRGLRLCHYTVEVPHHLYFFPVRLHDG
jgi:hypothetical protein